jgi:predicted aspartyl protease
MGTFSVSTFSVSMLVGNLEKTSFVEVQALADTGSVHSYIPQAILESVNVRPTETRAFAFADERVVDIPFGYAVFVIEGMEVIAPVIFAAEGGSPLLGATTLEAAHLATDSVNERLTPVLSIGRFGNGNQNSHAE